MRERFAVALYDHWQRDVARPVPWAEASPHLKKVFLRKADVVIKAMFDGIVSGHLTFR